MATGHFWTLWPHIGAVLAPPTPPPSRHFRTEARDPSLGTVRLTGRFSSPPEARTLVLLVHGLGGSAASSYMMLAARAAHDAGMATLRLNLRGADRSGEDYYHAGLTSDLKAALGSAAARPYERVFIWGFSLGGHVTLRLMTEDHDPRIAGAVAVCTPVDLAAAARAFDEPRRVIYRRYVLGGLKDIYREVYLRRGGPAGLPDAMAIDTLEEWDNRIIAPRHGFADADDYWEKVGVGPRLGFVDRPTLVVQAEADPMIPMHTVRPTLDAAPNVDTRWIPRPSGGHVGFPKDLDLGVDASPGLEAQVLGWMARA